MNLVIYAGTTMFHQDRISDRHSLGKFLELAWSTCHYE